ncbi:MAG: PorT family protein [Bacteroidales bacterium]|nr:PorT family protein [Bacteroidales bacterium]
MKQISALIIVLLLSSGLMAQEISIANDSIENTARVTSTTDSSTFINDQEDELKQLLSVEGLQIPENVAPEDTTIITGTTDVSAGEHESGDTVKVRIGDKNIQIIEKDEKTHIEIFDNENEEVEDTFCVSKKKQKFRGHWAGVEIGLNNLLDAGGSISRTPETSFMELNASRSLNVNLNFMQYSIGIFKDRMGFTSGLGLEFSNYFFSNDNTIDKNNGSVVSVDTLGNLHKTKLTTTYLRMPLIIEGQLFGKSRDKRLYVSAGLIGGLRLGSHTKIVTSEEEGSKKSKNNDDFYLNPFRWGLTARIGYKGITLYGDYYLTPLFQKNKGPELFPFSAGLSLTF